MFPNFTPFDIPVSPNIQIHGLQSPSPSPTAPPLLLLHGFPQNLNIWHRTAPALSTTYKVILLDLRGYGSSSKPPAHDDEKHVTYGKRTMARDIVTVMKELGFPKFYVCAHDRGARATHRLMIDYPDVVIKAIILDIAPTLGMYESTNFEFAKAYSHWFFLIRPAPYPEKLILAAPDAFIEGHMGRHGTMNIFDKTCLESYIKGVGDPEGIHGMCEDYRAGASIDMEEAREDVAQGRKIKCPIKVLWGTQGVIEKLFDALGEWRKVSEAEVTGHSFDCGHYIPEEKPEELIRAIKEFFV